MFIEILADNFLALFGVSGLFLLICLVIYYIMRVR